MKILKYLNILNWFKQDYSSQSRHSKWAKFKQELINKHPFCSTCGTKKYLTVHHIYPVGWPDGKELELVEENCIVICESFSHNCHFIFGHLLYWLSRNPDVVKDCEAFLKKIKNRPLNK